MTGSCGPTGRAGVEMHFDSEDWCYMEGHYYRDDESTCKRCGEVNEPLRKYLRRQALWSVREYFRPLVAVWRWVFGR